MRRSVRPFVSVIIPTYNRKDILELVLRSLAQQTYPSERYEVIVVDDGSDDGTDGLAKQMSHAVPYALRYLRQERQGARSARARNLGMGAASGEVLLFLDSDIVASPELVAEHAMSHAREPRLVVIGYSSGQSLNMLYDKYPFHSAEAIRKLLGGWTERHLEVQRLPEFRELYYKECADNLMALDKPWKVLHTNNVSVRKRNFLPLDEAFIGWGVHDLELGYRFYRKGLTFLLNRSAMGFHVESEAAYCPYRTPSLENWREHVDNLRYFARKHRDKGVWELCWHELRKIPREAKTYGRVAADTASNDDPLHLPPSGDARDSPREQFLALRADCFDSVLIEGGEPLIQRGIVQLLREGAGLGMHVAVRTNARALCYKDYAEEMVRAGLKEIEVAYYAHDSLLSDYLTGAKGGHSQTERGIQNALHAGISVRARIPVVPENALFIREAEERLRALGIVEIASEVEQAAFIARPWLLQRRIAQLEQMKPEGIVLSLLEELRAIPCTGTEQGTSVALLGYPATEMTGDRLGGTERCTTLTREWLSHEGVRAKIFARSADSGETISLRSGLPPVEVLGDSYEDAAQEDIRYYRDFQAKNGDFVILHGVNSPFLAIIADRPSVVDLHCPVPFPHYESLKGGYAAGHYVVHSEWMRSWLRSGYPDIPPAQVHLIYNAVDTATFRPEGRRQNRGPYTFYFGSAWVPRKGIFTFLEAVRILRQRRMDFEVWLAGTPYLYNNGKMTASQRELERHVKAISHSLGCVKQLGLVPHGRLPEVYNAADAVVFPSEWEEPFGLVVVEALSCGTPVIATGVGGIPEVLARYPPWLIVPPKDAVALAVAMERAMNGRRSLAAAARSWRTASLSKFTSIRYTDALLRLYSQVAERGTFNWSTKSAWPRRQASYGDPSRAGRSRREASAPRGSRPGSGLRARAG